MRIGHYQCKCVQGDFEANLATVIHGLDLAAETGLDIVSFPESFLQGYFRTKEEARANCCTIDAPEIEKLLDQTREYRSLFMVGFNELRGEELHNTVAVIDKGVTASTLEVGGHEPNNTCLQIADLSGFGSQLEPVTFRE